MVDKNLAWAVKQLERHFQDPQGGAVVMSVTTSVNERGNIELIMEFNPHFAKLIGKALFMSGHREENLQEELEDDSK